jgi:hypothetical protein
MAKAYIELRYRKRKYKLNADDISRVCKVARKQRPAIPVFEEVVKILS